MSCDAGEVTESLENENELRRRWSDWKLGKWPELILQPFFRLSYVTRFFTYVTKLSVTSTTSQFILILQAFRHFTYVRVHSPTFPSLYLRHNSFSNPSVASPMSQLILQSFCRFTCVTAHSPTLPLFHLRHSSFSNPTVALHTSQLIQLFRCFTYVTAHSPTLLSLFLHHRLFTYVTWRAAHAASFLFTKLEILGLHRVSAPCLAGVEKIKIPGNGIW